ncbi:MAG: protein-disulfide reductase DsbD family protein [Deltaproteobacteria bacterium]|nr:protein-disulfide reductase DsbD family protein [Deltaproteobacteria bacterium]
MLKPLFVVVVVAALAGCPEAPAGDGDFGKAKPLTNDGMVTKPGPVEKGPPDWAGALTVVPAYDASTSTLLVVLKIKDGFHAYGPGEEVSKPVAMSVDAVNGWAVEGAVDIPAGKKKDLGALGTSVILEGDVPLKAKLSKGSGAISGVVEVQVCTDKACDRPKKHPFTIPG